MKTTQPHLIPSDMTTAISQDQNVHKLWGQITPLAQNEWICFVISAKQSTTRRRRILRMVNQLSSGQRRPCCWPGCPHR